MKQKHAVVVTTINHPTHAVREINERSREMDATFYLVGDKKSPANFHLAGARYLDITAQVDTGFTFAKICPTGHYARKNVGYLLAMREGAEIIIETDDDNFPLDAFWGPRQRIQRAPLVASQGWCNVYAYFSSGVIWPRGLPLDQIHKPVSPVLDLTFEEADCPIQQGLADKNPDVDAIYRLVLPLPFDFEPSRTVVLDKGVWCPFNSQNTTFWRDAFPLLYLPYYCSFRMTDIWRSFVAQRLAWECGWRLQFHSSTVFQDRNEHDLMSDFADEVPGYLHNDRIRRTLEGLALASGVSALPDNLIKAYEALISLGVVGPDELPLLRAWLDDVARC